MTIITPFSLRLMVLKGCGYCSFALQHQGPGISVAQIGVSGLIAVAAVYKC